MSALCLADIDRLAGFIDPDIRFIRRKVNCAFRNTACPDGICAVPQIFNQFCDMGILFQGFLIPVQHLVYIAVGHPLRGTDKGRIQFEIRHGAVLFHLHLTGIGQTDHMGIQRADTVA